MGKPNRHPMEPEQQQKAENRPDPLITLNCAVCARNEIKWNDKRGDNNKLIPTTRSYNVCMNVWWFEGVLLPFQIKFVHQQPATSNPFDSHCLCSVILKFNFLAVWKSSWLLNSIKMSCVFLLWIVLVVGCPLFQFLVCISLFTRTFRIQLIPNNISNTESYVNVFFSACKMQNILMYSMLNGMANSDTENNFH